MEVFTNDDVRKLLWKKMVVVIGDSIQRCVYKDLVCLLIPARNNGYLTKRELKSKGELEFLSDKLLQGGQLEKMGNGINYREVRLFDAGTTVVKFYFVTRCYSEYMTSILNELKTMEPHIVIMNSCLWDLHRYGLHGPAAYKLNLDKLMFGLKKSLPSDALFIWNAALPLSSKCKGGFLLPYYDSLPCKEILEANFFARNIILQHNFSFLDLHLVFSNQLDRRVGDGVHWDHVAHRRISNLLLMKISQHSNIPVPRRMLTPSLLGDPPLPLYPSLRPMSKSFSSYPSLLDRYGYNEGYSDARYIVGSSVNETSYKKRFKFISPERLSLTSSTETSPTITNIMSTPVSYGPCKTKQVGLLPTPIFHSSPLEFCASVPNSLSPALLYQDFNSDLFPMSNIFDSPTLANSAISNVSRQTVQEANVDTNSEHKPELCTLPDFNDPSIDLRTTIESTRNLIKQEAYRSLSGGHHNGVSAENSDTSATKTTSLLGDCPIVCPTVRNQSLPDLRSTLESMKSENETERKSEKGDGSQNISVRSCKESKRRESERGSVNRNRYERERSSIRETEKRKSSTREHVESERGVKRKATDDSRYYKDKYSKVECYDRKGTERRYEESSGRSEERESHRSRSRFSSFKAKTTAKFSSVVNKVSSVLHRVKRERNTEKSGERSSKKGRKREAQCNGRDTYEPSVKVIRKEPESKTILEKDCKVEERDDKRINLEVRACVHSDFFPKPSMPVRTQRYEEISPEEKAKMKEAAYLYTQRYSRSARDKQQQSTHQLQWATTSYGRRQYWMYPSHYRQDSYWQYRYY